MRNIQDLELEDLCFNEDEEALEGVAFEGYRVVRILGRGAGGGAVYEVWSATGGRRAAAKWPVHSAEQEALKDLEGCLGVPELFGSGILDGKRYVVTEILGRPLSEAFAGLRARPLLRRWQAVCVVGRLLLRRLKAIHSRGWLHCDLKPENVLLGSPSGAPTPDTHRRPYLIDYGNSRRHPGGLPMRGDWGSVDFNSIASAADGERGPADDVEALGWMLLHLLFGELPWFQWTRETNWKDKEKRLETVQQVRRAKAQALDRGWGSLGDRWRRLAQLPPAMDEFLHGARAKADDADEAGGAGAGKRPNYKHLAELLGAREGFTEWQEEEEDLFLLPLALEEARVSSAGDSHKAREEDEEAQAGASNQKMVWEVVGGGDSGGILVRDGRETSSAQKLDRLVTGALVQEESLEGQRLCYKRLLGEGPETGWVSIKMKERDLLVRRGAKGSLLDPKERRKHRPPPKPKEPQGWWADWDALLRELDAPRREPAAASAAPAAPPTGRPPRTDILVYGATGFTGTLACEMLARQQAPHRTWAIAGRDGRKLQLLEEKFGTDSPLFRGAICAASVEEIENAVSNVRVVVDFSGPAFQVGAVVAEACVKAGAHYVDTSCYEGDVLAARSARERLHAAAARKGVALVFFCAAYPVQVDFGVWWVVKHFREKYGIPTRRVDVYQNQTNFVLGGTPVLSFLGKPDHVSQAARLNPFMLGGTRQEGLREEDLDEPAAAQHGDSGLWLFPGGRNAEVMISRCSCGMLDEIAPYGKRFLLKVWDIFKSKSNAEAGTINNAFLRKNYASLLEQGKVPPPGHGAPRALQQAGTFARVFEAKADEQSSKRRRVHCLLHAGSKSIGDPCKGTAFVALEACGCLLDAADAGGAIRAGFGTPVWHLAHHNFSQRLVDAGYWCWSPTEKGSPSALLLHRLANWGGGQGQGPAGMDTSPCFRLLWSSRRMWKRRSRSVHPDPQVRLDEELLRGVMPDVLASDCEGFRRTKCDRKGKRRIPSVSDVQHKIDMEALGYDFENGRFVTDVFAPRLSGGANSGTGRRPEGRVAEDHASKNAGRRTGWSPGRFVTDVFAPRLSGGANSGTGRAPEGRVAEDHASRNAGRRTGWSPGFRFFL